MIKSETPSHGPVKGRTNAPALETWIDISVPMQNGMVTWPGNTPFEIGRTQSLDAGDACNVSQVRMSVHSGTHMDAPAHFLHDGCGIDEMALTATIGPARIIAIENPNSITKEELTRHCIRRRERVLFKTRNSSHPWYMQPFQENFVHISVGAAEWWARREVRAVGIDYLSVGGIDHNSAVVHRALLGAGVWIIEGLILADVEPGRYSLICLPLKLVGSDGAPARAILRPRR